MSPAVPGLRPGVGRGRRQVALRRHGVPLGLHELAVGAPLGVRCGLALPDSGGGDVDQGTHPGLVGGGGGEVVRGQHQQLYSPTQPMSAPASRADRGHELLGGSGERALHPVDLAASSIQPRSEQPPGRGLVRNARDSGHRMHAIGWRS